MADNSILNIKLKRALDDGDSDVTFGFIALIAGLLLGLVNFWLGALIGLTLFAYFLPTFIRDLFKWKNFQQYFSDPVAQKQESPISASAVRSALSNSSRSSLQRSPNIQATSSAPLTGVPTIADRIKDVHLKNDFKCPACGATVEPTAFKCKHCGSILVTSVDLPAPKNWRDVEVGQTILIKHPNLGELSRSVQYRIYYGELWQEKMRADVPWTLTGGYYAGLGLGEDMYLLNWQSRFFIFDSKTRLTDMDINQKFARAAREFAASNQTKSVTFTLDTVWRIEDIGRYRIEYVEGDKVGVSPGAVGRFIHASHNNRMLVVEDFQSGGSGLDTQWMGYRITEEDIKL